MRSFVERPRAFAVLVAGTALAFSPLGVRPARSCRVAAKRARGLAPAPGTLAAASVPVYIHVMRSSTVPVT
ncbi:hypothetical protein [Kribbella sp. ALI-6-A]|uniref:hypothetical protein n=1 Tax=Kribbella sp. ALI-6-A TaxID=1933817 RepID=UPI001EDC9225|nr:hypothetical protein [Kribbella sp. ALI-6-A]